MRKWLRKRMDENCDNKERHSQFLKRENSIDFLLARGWFLVTRFSVRVAGQWIFRRPLFETGRWRWKNGLGILKIDVDGEELGMMFFTFFSFSSLRVFTFSWILNMSSKRRSSEETLFSWASQNLRRDEDLLASPFTSHNPLLLSQRVQPASKGILYVSLCLHVLHADCKSYSKNIIMQSAFSGCAIIFFERPPPHLGHSQIIETFQWKKALYDPRVF